MINKNTQGRVHTCQVAGVSRSRAVLRSLFVRFASKTTWQSAFQVDHQG